MESRSAEGACHLSFRLLQHGDSFGEELIQHAGSRGRSRLTTMTGITTSLGVAATIDLTDAGAACPGRRPAPRRRPGPCCSRTPPFGLEFIELCSSAAPADHCDHSWPGVK